jgi:hypothetical protein
MRHVSAIELLGQAYDQDELLEFLCRDDLKLSARAALLRAWATYETVLPEGDRAFLRAIDAYLRAFIADVAQMLPGESQSAEVLVEGRLRALLCRPAWRWPVAHGGVGGGQGALEILRDFSALKLFGYTVGKTKGWEQSKRHAFLSDFIERDLPPIVQQHFGEEYGRPLSTDRLRKVANIIAGNCSLNMRHDPERYSVAISDYLVDLEFLKDTYYDGMGLKVVPWPDPRR